jgi:hypothetical protein
MGRAARHDQAHRRDGLRPSVIAPVWTVLARVRCVARRPSVEGRSTHSSHRLRRSGRADGRARSGRRPTNRPSRQRTPRGRCDAPRRTRRGPHRCERAARVGRRPDRVRDVRVRRRHRQTSHGGPPAARRASSRAHGSRPIAIIAARWSSTPPRRCSRNCGTSSRPRYHLVDAFARERLLRGRRRGFD